MKYIYKADDCSKCIAPKMKYLYTADDCPKCIALKEKYDKAGIAYIERDASFVKNPQIDADRDALVQLCLNNNTLPVEVEI